MSSRTLRAPVVFVALVGLVLGVLLCGASAVKLARKAAGAGAVPVAASVSGTLGTELASAPEQPHGPGCGRGHGGEGAVSPVVPPRAHGFGELLPALTSAARTSCAGGDAGLDGPAPVPGPDPPELAPPTPVELSILRV